MYGNKVHLLPIDAFSDCQNLEVLQISGNEITSLGNDTANVLAGLVKLKTFRFGVNLITSLPDNIFSGFNQLETLHMARNRIEALPEKIFDDLVNLKVLQIHDNLLTTLPGTVFNGLVSLETLYLGDNPWSCDCNMTELRRWLDDNKDRISYTTPFASFTCASPAKHAGRLVMDIPLGELTCESSTPNPTLPSVEPKTSSAPSIVTSPISTGASVNTKYTTQSDDVTSVSGTEQFITTKINPHRDMSD
ncbi:leucine-rich repeat-containing protein 15-like [Ptychodera flava]|uniref:leucine-rich repeat-containing protein 15-like n=1 Tax=Ptychodera flava TaxID=63121 RepID=UPI00396A6C3D